MNVKLGRIALFWVALSVPALGQVATSNTIDFRECEFCFVGPPALSNSVTIATPTYSATTMDFHGVTTSPIPEKKPDLIEDDGSYFTHQHWHRE